MLITEEEAKTKWCPHRRSIEFNYHVSSTPVATNATATCIASDCMAWRRHETRQFKSRADMEFHRSGKRLSPPGFCGLAGAPTCDERDYR